MMHSNISPADLRNFAQSLGWQILPQGIKDGFYVLSHPDFEKRQLIFPMDPSVLDYSETIDLVLYKLADMMGEPVVDIIKKIKRGS
jgi:hypothetical protein